MYTISVHSYYEKLNYFLTFKQYQTALNAYNTINAQDETRYTIHDYLTIATINNKAPDNTKQLFDTSNVYYLVKDYIN